MHWRCIPCGRESSERHDETKSSTVNPFTNYNSRSHEHRNVTCDDASDTEIRHASELYSGIEFCLHFQILSHFIIIIMIYSSIIFPYFSRQEVVGHEAERIICPGTRARGV